MNNFKKSSLVEREKMEKIFNKFNVLVYNFTDEDGFDKHDGSYINSKKEHITFEVKVRNVPNNKYSTTVIEKSKYDYLMNLENTTPYLFIFFSDNTYFIHKLSKDNNYKQTKMKAPKTTAADNSMIMKDFVEIKIDKSTVYNQ